MRYWREVGHRMMETPALQEVAARESSPFVHDPIADWISDALVGGIMTQARRARQKGRPVVAPQVSGDPLVFWEALSYLRCRAGWLDRPGVHVAIRVAPPGPAVVALREQVVHAVEAQLTAHGPALALSESIPGGARR